MASWLSNIGFIPRKRVDFDVPRVTGNEPQYAGISSGGAVATAVGYTSPGSQSFAIGYKSGYSRKGGGEPQLDDEIYPDIEVYARSVSLKRRFRITACEIHLSARCSCLSISGLVNDINTIGRIEMGGHLYKNCVASLTSTYLGVSSTEYSNEAEISIICTREE